MKKILQKNLFLIKEKISYIYPKNNFLNKKNVQPTKKFSPKNFLCLNKKLFV